MNRKPLLEWCALWDQHQAGEFDHLESGPAMPMNDLVKSMKTMGFDMHEIRDLLGVLLETCDQCWRKSYWCKCQGDHTDE